jgi:cytochrome d ubiquinol oxidase subunit I
VVHGLIRTAEAVSPVGAEQIAPSLAAFIVVYLFVFGAGTYYILRLIAKGPQTGEEVFGAHGVDKPPIFTDMASEKGGDHV